MHLAPLIRDLAIISAVAGLVTLIFQRIKQPVVLGYIVAGIIVGPHTPPFPLVTDLPNIRTLAELGVIFLMFTLGLEFSFRKLTRVGTSAAITAPLEISAMIGLGFFSGKLFGWSTMDSVFLGAMVSISSTTIIIKAFEEIGLKTRRFAEIVFGILIVEDLVAILLMVALSTVAATGSISSLSLVTSAGKLGLVVGAWFLVGYFMVPRFVRYTSKFRSEETLTLLSIGLCLGLVVIATSFHYSAALGAFIMGSILAESSESRRIEELMTPLRDLFGAIFFVSVGMLMDPVSIWNQKWAILLLTSLVIGGKTFSITLGSLVTGQTLRTSVLVGFSLGQIGEFSFIIATLGLTLGVMSDFLYPVAVAVSLITTFTTPYLIRHSPKLADFLERHMPSKIRIFLNGYAAWRERQSGRVTRGPEFDYRLFRWFVGGFVVTLIAVLVSEYGLPIIRDYVEEESWSFAIGWVLTALLSAPFIWIMFVAFRGYRPPNEDESPLPARVAFIVSNTLSLAWLSILSMAFFPARYIGIIASVIGIFLFFRLYRQLEASYQWFEKSFLSTFRSAEKSKKPIDIYRRLAPWDGHLVRLKVHADSEVSGKELQQVALRKRYGLNVVAIQRGSKAIVAPRPDQVIFPKDELLVLGTDEQVDRIRPAIEAPQGPEIQMATIAGYELKKLFISEKNPLCGRTIRQSRIREQYSSMVVGIERKSRRIMNPDSDLEIEPQDTLWLVGESSQLDQLIKDHAES